MIISYSWTTPAVIVGEKEVTRREWDPHYAARFRDGMHCQAYDKSPRVHGKPFGIVELLGMPYVEVSSNDPQEDWRREGFEYLTRIGAKVHGSSPLMVWESWRLFPQPFYVVRFRLVGLNAYGESLREVELRRAA